MVETIKKRGGRPRKIKPEVITPEMIDKSAGIAEVPQEKGKKAVPRTSGWPTPRAVKIKIFTDPENGFSAGPFKLGDSQALYIRRGVEVIVPWDVLSILDDCVVQMPKCDMSVLPPRYYEEPETRFQYANLGEVPWEEFEKFRAEEAKKPYYIEKRA